MSTQPEALRLASELTDDIPGCPGLDDLNVKAAAELRRLHADAEESEALRERLSALLTSTAIALRGPAPELVSWSWHDLPERAAALVAQRDALLKEFKALQEVLLYSLDNQGRYRKKHQKIVDAAIKAAEGEKT